MVGSALGAEFPQKFSVLCPLLQGDPALVQAGRAGSGWLVLCDFVLCVEQTDTFNYQAVIPSAEPVCSPLTAERCTKVCFSALIPASLVPPRQHLCPFPIF